MDITQERDRTYEIGRTDLIAARATAGGPGAVAIVRVDGEGACELVEGFFQAKGNETISGRPRHAIFGTWFGSPGEGQGDNRGDGRGDGRGENRGEGQGDGLGPEGGTQPIDDGICIYFKAPHSYTGNDLVELQCHGGPVVARRLLAELLRRGARLAQPGEFTRRAFMNGRIDLAQAEAVADLIRAETDSAARTAQRQLAGGLSGEVGALREELIELAAEIEARIDFPDEGIDAADLKRLTEGFEKSAVLLERLLASRRRGRLLREGATVVLVGSPNVGKSSLLNALCRTERAIVTPHAGTTRDTLEATVDMGGIPVTLVDTAGLRKAEGQVEKIGIERAREALRGADLVIEVRDVSRSSYGDGDGEGSGEGEGDADGLEASSFLTDRPPDLIADNKIDLLDANADADARPKTPPDAAPDTPPDAESGSESEAKIEADAGRRESNGTARVRVSAKSGEGLADLENAIAAMLEGEGSGATISQSAINERHATLIESALVSLESARTAWDEDLGHELVMIDLRETLAALDEILGLAPNEAVLDRIFERFCLGK